jgi:hypothetical protein
VGVSGIASNELGTLIAMPDKIVTTVLGCPR